MKKEEPETISFHQPTVWQDTTVHRPKSPSKARTPRARPFRRLYIFLGLVAGAVVLLWIFRNQIR